MKDEMFDIVILIIILGIAISIGLFTIVNTYEDVVINSNNLYTNKNTKTIAGEPIELYGDYKSTYNKLGVLLCTQIQDYEMPYPKRISIDSKDIDITSTYQVDLIGYAEQTWDAIKNDANDTEYNIVYDMGTEKMKDNDDTNRIQRNN